MDDGNTEGDSEGGPEGELVSPNQPSPHHIVKVLFFIGLTITALCLLIIYRPSILPAPLRPLLFIPIANSPLKRFKIKARRSPPIPHAGTPTVGSQGFRVGEDRLVRWAQEDMTLEGDGEVDTMVNGSLEDDNDDRLERSGVGEDYSYGYGYGAAGVGSMGAEYIPLKPSPFVGVAHGKSHPWGGRGYGSVVIGSPR
ncbi:hypothetical protein ONZ45_g11264 [Pleurotus djamor]|nr:hypothetical protein ONZ45_g11264 [Pleurotus djamor]